MSLCRTWTCRPEVKTCRDVPLELKVQLQAGGSAGASQPGKLNWCFSAPLSPLNYSSGDGAPETTALSGSQHGAGGIL